ncbi:MAG: TolC family protein [Prevotella sp.]|nr:TolC family protein [Prevotella sp.]
MKKNILIGCLFAVVMPVMAQRELCLDSCRALALRNNKQLSISRVNQDVARNVRRSVRTKYLPKVDAVGGYEYFSREVSILNNRQKNALSNLGNSFGANIGATTTELITSLAQQGMIDPQMAQQLGQMATSVTTPLVEAGNQIGNTIRDAFKTDNKNMWGGAVTVRQPIFMGGAIKTANNMADIQEEMARNDLDFKTQTTLYSIDKTYWTVVSLRQKQLLVQSYLDLVKKLDNDVHKLIDEGFATRADGLKVDVKVNEAEMQITQVENGLSLAKMLLCQICGLPLDEDIVLTDEVASYLPLGNEELSVSRASRPEIRLLQNAVELSEQATRLIRAEYLPHVALTGGYMISNPNVFNGFERHFAGVWNIGVLVQVPVWTWMESKYKIRASKGATAIAELELNDLQEKVELQVTQGEYKLREARKRLASAQKNILSAEENLRCANIGFQEGVMESTDVMAAQTAWQMAQSQKIDAEIDLRMAEVNLRKAQGSLIY